MSARPFPRRANTAPMNRRLTRKAIRRDDLDGIVRYGVAPAFRSIIDAFAGLPEDIQQTVRQVAVLASLIAEPVLVCPQCFNPIDDHPTTDCWYVDKSECAYFRRLEPGADPQGICSFDCIEEPECVTGGPWDHYVEVAPSAVRASL